MRIGIIDFGTNTLRLDIFETEDKEYRSIYDFAIYSKIVENTVGTSLSQDGIELCAEAVVRAVRNAAEELSGRETDANNSKDSNGAPV